MRTLKSVTEEERERIYSLSRSGISDEALCDRFDIDMDVLWCVLEYVFCSLQERRGFKGCTQAKGLLRDDGVMR